jgi:hypothetical protein
VCALLVDTRNETAEYLGSLALPARKRLDYVFRRLIETGSVNEVTFKQLDGIVYEIKEHKSNTRFYCFLWRPNLIICTHGARKPAGRARYQVEIEKVKRWSELCLREGVIL